MVSSGVIVVTIGNGEQYTFDFLEQIALGRRKQPSRDLYRLEQFEARAKELESLVRAKVAAESGEQYSVG